MSTNLNRRNFLNLTGTDLAGMLFLGISSAQAIPNRPNFIIILVDDFGYVNLNS